VTAFLMNDVPSTVIQILQNFGSFYYFHFYFAFLLFGSTKIIVFLLLCKFGDNAGKNFWNDTATYRGNILKINILPLLSRVIYNPESNSFTAAASC
jgi:hypothetical protein